MEIKEQVQEEKTKEIEKKSVSLVDNDWKVLSSSLVLLAQNVGKLGIDPTTVGNVYQNCLAFVNEINQQTQ